MVLSGPSFDTNGCNAFAVSAALVVTIRCLIGEVSEIEIWEMVTRSVGVVAAMPFRRMEIAEPDCWNA